MCVCVCISCLAARFARAHLRAAPHRAVVEGALHVAGHWPGAASPLSVSAARSLYHSPLSLPPALPLHMWSPESLGLRHGAAGAPRDAADVAHTAAVANEVAGAHGVAGRHRRRRRGSPRGRRSSWGCHCLWDHRSPSMSHDMLVSHPIRCHSPLCGRGTHSIARAHGVAAPQRAAACGVATPLEVAAARRDMEANGLPEAGVSARRVAGVWAIASAGRHESVGRLIS